MIMQMFTVRDSAVNACLKPFFVRSKGEAIRSFMEACKDLSHEFNKHAADYTLFAIGEFDDETGLVKPYLSPERVLGAMEVISREAAPN